MNRIEAELKKHGPMLSGKLCRILEDDYGISSDAARKVVSRTSHPVRKIKTLPFKNNQVFVCLEEQYNKPIFRKNLYLSLKESSYCLSSILVALENFGGTITKDLLPIYSYSPVQKTKGHRLFSDDIKKLKSIGIIIEREEHYELSYEYSGIKPDYTESRCISIINMMLVNDFVAWSKKLNLMAFNSAKTYPEETCFAHFSWFASSPSYYYPVSIDGKNGFSVVDVLWKTKATIEDVRFFVEKVNTIKNFRKLYRFAPVLLVKDLTNEAFSYLKEKQVMFFVISNLFDANYTSTLEKIYNIIRNPISAIKNNPSSIEEIIEETNKFNGKFNDIMGAFFESLVGLFIVKLGYELLNMNIKIPNSDGNTYEFDIVARKETTIKVIECKARRHKLNKGDIGKWLTTRAPCIFEWAKAKYPECNFNLEIWSLGGFEKAAKIILEKHKATNASQYDFNFRDKNEMQKYAQNKGKSGRKFINDLKRFYSDY